MHDRLERDVFIFFAVGKCKLIQVLPISLQFIFIFVLCYLLIEYEIQDDSCFTAGVVILRAKFLS